MLFQDRMEDGKSSMDVKYLFQFIGWRQSNVEGEDTLL
jgi:hypothetical protein